MKRGLGITSVWCRRLVGPGSDGGGMDSLTRAEIGALGEQLAVDHLTSLGLRVLTRNWRCRYGELDVIAVDITTCTVMSSRSRPAPATSSAVPRRW